MPALPTIPNHPAASMLPMQKHSSIHMKHPNRTKQTKEKRNRKNAVKSASFNLRLQSNPTSHRQSSASQLQIEMKKNPTNASLKYTHDISRIKRKSCRSFERKIETSRFGPTTSVQKRENAQRVELSKRVDA